MEPLAWLNGRTVLFSQAAVPVWDLGVVAGAAVTEMARTFHGKIFQLDAHLDRLLDSLAVTGIQAQLSRGDWQRIATDIVAHNWPLLNSDQADLGVILFATAGVNQTYLGPALPGEIRTGTVCVHTFPLPFALWSTAVLSGLRLQVPPTRAISALHIDPRIKFRSRLHWHLADREARLRDPQAQALLLDADGYVTETAAGNLVVRRGNRVLTPSPQRCLAGVSLNTIQQLLIARETQLEYADLMLHDLLIADEMFVTSTPTCLLPVTMLNGRPVGDGQPGQLSQQLLTDWSAAVSVDIRAQLLQNQPPPSVTG